MKDLPFRNKVLRQDRLRGFPASESQDSAEISPVKKKEKESVLGTVI